MSVMRVLLAAGLSLRGLGTPAITAAASGACGTGSCQAETTVGVSLIQTRPSRHHKAGEERRSVHTHRVGSSSASASAVANRQSPDYGDLTCMGWTGGTCKLLSCRDARGPTKCVSGKCMCTDHCATAEGKCEGEPGKWIGEYSVHFVKPYQDAKPYLGISDYDYYYMTGLQATDASEPSWKIALADGFVRFESVKKPGDVLTIYDSRRRRSNLMEKAVNDDLRLNTTDGTKGDDLRLNTTDDADLLPRARSLENVSPLDATFLVRKGKAGGFEIWDPHHDVAIAGADPDGWFQDNVADRGVAECSGSTLLGIGECDGEQIVAFSPGLPSEAVSSKGRIHIDGLNI